MSTRENEPAESTLSEDLLAELEKQEQEETEEVEEVVEEVEDSPVEDDSEEESEEVSEDSEEEIAEEIEETPEETEEETDSEEEVEPIAAPEHWSAIDKERFESIPREAQEFVLERHKSMEADYTRKTQDLASIRKRGEALEEIISPYRAEFQLGGMDDVAAIRQLFSVHDNLKRNPTQTIQWLAETYGADLNAEPEQVDPAIAQLRQQINQLHQERQTETLTAQQQQQQQLIDQIKSFEEEKGEDGKLKHPHFQTVHDDMVKMFQAGMVTELGEAYDKAVTLRGLQATPQSQPVKKDDKAEKAKIAKRAKKAASGVKSSGASVKKETPASLRDELEGLFNQQLNN